MSDEQREIQRENDNRYVIGDYDAMEDKIIPMKITTTGIKKSLKKRSEELERKEYKDYYSVDLPKKEF